MRRKVRRYLRRHVRRHTRRRLRQRPAAQPWHRRYRVPLMVAILFGYAIIYCFIGVPLQFGHPMQGSFDAIHYGMTVEEVENILGEPSAIEPDGPRIWFERWGAIIVDFDGHRVRSKEFLPLNQPRRLPRYIL